MFPGEECPDAKVELALLVEHRLLHVLLHDPEGVQGAGKDELLNILDVPEDLDPLALIHSCRFHQPDIVLAVLERQAFLLAAAIVDFLEAVHELGDLVVVRVGGHQEGGGGRVEHLVPILVRLFVAVVELLEGPDQAGLRAETTQDLEMVVDEGGARLSQDFLVDFVVA